ncbi:MAG: cell division protein FtsQ/DivIB [Solirubrobacteraceae bacterium]
MIAGGWFALHSRIFSARVVTVAGSTHTPYRQVVRAAGLEGAPPLVDVGAGAAAGVDRLPWVSSAHVAREWPDGVRIDVVERTPAAAVAERGRRGTGRAWAVVDRSGRVLEIASKVPAGLVVVSGQGRAGVPGSTVAADHSALGVAASLPKAFSSQVTRVVEDAQGQVTMHLESPVEVDLGPANRLRQKYEDVSAILAGAQLAPGDVIDVSAPGAPVVESPDAAGTRSPGA